MHGIRPEWAETTLAGVREPPVSVTSRSEKAGKADTSAPVKLFDWSGASPDIGWSEPIN